MTWADSVILYFLYIYIYICTRVYLIYVYIYMACISLYGSLYRMAVVPPSGSEITGVGIDRLTEIDFGSVKLLGHFSRLTTTNRETTLEECNTVGSQS